MFVVMMYGWKDRMNERSNKVKCITLSSLKLGSSTWTRVRRDV